MELYSTAAPVPNQMTDADTKPFLAEIRELVGLSLLENGGELRGWAATDEESAKYTSYAELMRRYRIEPWSMQEWLSYYRQHRRQRGT